MSKPGADPSSGTSLGDALRLPKRHPACRRREAQSGSRKKLPRRRRLVSWLAVRIQQRSRDLPPFHPLRVDNVDGQLVRNVRTWPAMSREKAQAAPTARPKVPMRRRGADCPVVVSKRVQCSCSEGGRSSPWGASQLATGGAPILDGRRQPSCGGTSRMTRECQVRIWCSEASCHSSG